MEKQIRTFTLIALLGILGVNFAFAQANQAKENMKTYYAYAQAVIDNGTLVVSELQEVKLASQKNAEQQKMQINALKLHNHQIFLKMIQSRYSKLMSKTKFPAGFNAIEIFETKEEAQESLNFLIASKEKNMLKMPDFKITQLAENKTALDEVIID
jgi:uncharacterized protein YfcZ (UPF0381/DUF406 family)